MPHKTELKIISELAVFQYKGKGKHSYTSRYNIGSENIYYPLYCFYNYMAENVTQYCKYLLL